MNLLKFFFLLLVLFSIFFLYLAVSFADKITYCPECGELLIRRAGYRIVANRTGQDAACPNCGARIAGVGLSGEPG